MALETIQDFIDAVRQEAASSANEPGSSLTFSDHLSLAFFAVSNRYEQRDKAPNIEVMLIATLVSWTFGFTLHKHKIGDTLEPGLLLMEPENRERTIAVLEEPHKVFLPRHDKDGNQIWSHLLGHYKGRSVTIAFRHNEGTDTFTIVEVK